MKDLPLDELRAKLVAAVGPAAAGQAVATVAAFSGLVRVADSTGIPIDDGLAVASSDFRDDLGLGAYGGSANSANVAELSGAFTEVNALWS